MGGGAQPVRLTERDIEAAEAAVSAESDSAIARIREQLAGAGEDDCTGCGQPIPKERRRAMPSAERCVRCQIQFERDNS